MGEEECTSGEVVTGSAAIVVLVAVAYAAIAAAYRLECVGAPRHEIGHTASMVKSAEVATPATPASGWPSQLRRFPFDLVRFPQ